MNIPAVDWGGMVTNLLGVAGQSNSSVINTIVQQAVMGAVITAGTNALGHGISLPISLPGFGAAAPAASSAAPPAPAVIAGNASAVTTITLSQFSTLDATTQTAFIKAGGHIAGP